MLNKFSPADSAIKEAHDEYGEGEVPGVTHGDKHHVAVIHHVPLRAMGRVQHKPNLHPNRVSGVGGALTSSLLQHCQSHTNLPEPAALQECESAAQQLQDDVSAVEDLQEGDQSLTKDGEEQELMQVDVQHAPTMEVVEEEKSCKKKADD